MSRLSNYLVMESTESGRTKSISEEEFIKLLTSKCGNSIEAMSHGKNIYRGDRNQGKFFHGDGKLNTRLSRNTSNYYTLWMDNHPQWSHYPKRSKSFVCTTDRHYARGFGSDMKIVIPYDGVEIGVCNTFDLWSSFPIITKSSMAYSMDDFNDTIETFINTVLGDHSSSYDGSWNEYKKAIEKVDNDYDMDYILSVTDNGGSISELAKEVKKNGSLMKALEYCMKPDLNNFNLIKNQSHLPSVDRELWMEGPILMVDEYELGQSLLSWMYDKGITK